MKNAMSMKKKVMTRVILVLREAMTYMKVSTVMIMKKNPGERR